MCVCFLCVFCVCCVCVVCVLCVCVCSLSLIVYFFLTGKFNAVGISNMV